eukprot:9128127-Alexandrium_andersonii.AAC.1
MRPRTVRGARRLRPRLHLHPRRVRVPGHSPCAAPATRRPRTASRGAAPALPTKFVQRASYEPRGNLRRRRSS